jgi:uncharacterized protein YaaQ
MKLVVAVVHSDDAAPCVDALSERGYGVTRLNSSGGFLKQGNSTLVAGVEDEEVEEAVSIIRDNCRTRMQLMNPYPPIPDSPDIAVSHPVEVQVGGATIFVMAVERFEKL